MQGQAESSNVPLAVDEKVEDVETLSKKADTESIVDNDNRDTEFAVSSIQSVDGAAQVVEKDSDVEGIVSTGHQLIEEDSLLDEMGGDGQLETSN
ncbi:hypothetical protein HS088_TW17G00830 [Tripterygium wilfordii]|uniref:Uncharacterized protein n=1 Tax=Tripterygium wilfordii TaxID=458696 RepID=A0A7J7CGV5_TRIWF|nr:hypothetical protein HS088_TW17G00830 [Tripterygium wilfordii]